MKSKCLHDWRYVHTVYDGGRKGDCAVVRYCFICERQEMAFVNTWGPVPRRYVDAKREARP